MTKRFAPTPIPVKLSEDGKPESFVWHGKRRRVMRVCNYWREEGQWWTQPVFRDYYKLLTQDGLLCVVYEDRESSAEPPGSPAVRESTWYFEKLFD